MVDGNIGVIQTMVGELVKKPEHERKPTPCPIMMLPRLLGRTFWVITPPNYTQSTVV